MAIDLQTLFQSDPAAQELGLKLIGDDRAQSKASLEQMMMKMDQDRQMFPHKLKEAEVANETGMARLPGIREQGRGLKLQNDFDEQTLAPRIQEALNSYKGKMSKQDFDDLVNTGNIYSQAGQLLFDIPGVASHARAKEILKDKYLPEFDQVPPQALGGVIRYLGQNMVNLQPDFVKKEALEKIKGEARTAAEEEKTRRAMQLAEFKAGVQKQLAEAKAKAVQTKDPKTAREMSNRLFRLAREEQDPEKKAVLMEEAEAFNEIAFTELSRRADATNANKPNLPALGIETNPMPPTPSLPGAQPQTAPPQQTPKPASLADVQKMYPGVPADKLREAYKRKFGVDLQ